jgi:hypothetical protein
MKIKLSDIETFDKQSFIICKYVARDGSVIKKKYSYASLSESKRAFRNYINENKLA